jgi:hypothetical protein
VIDLAGVRGVPIWLLREYLVELGGAMQPDGSVAGDGWLARLTQLDDYRISSLRVGQVRLELTGEDAARESIQALLMRKLSTRAGG